MARLMGKVRTCVKYMVFSLACGIFKVKAIPTVYNLEEIPSITIENQYLSQV